MNRSICTRVLALFIAAAVYPAAQSTAEQTSATQTAPGRHELTFKMQVETTRDRKATDVANSLTYEFSQSAYSLLAGIKLGAESSDITVAGTWMPLRMRLFSFGPQIEYNFDLFMNYSMEHNFLFGAKATVGRPDRLLVTAECSYLLKLTDFYRLPAIPLLRDDSIATTLSFASILRNRMKIAFKIYSHDTFYYPLFCTPTYEMQLGWIVTPDFTVESSLMVRYSDMFTLTSYVSNIQGNVAIRYTLPRTGSTK